MNTEDSITKASREPASLKAPERSPSKIGPGALESDFVAVGRLLALFVSILEVEELTALFSPAQTVDLEEVLQRVRVVERRPDNFIIEAGTPSATAYMKLLELVSTVVAKESLWPTDRFVRVRKELALLTERAARERENYQLIVQELAKAKRALSELQQSARALERKKYAWLVPLLVGAVLASSAARWPDITLLAAATGCAVAAVGWLYRSARRTVGRSAIAISQYIAATLLAAEIVVALVKLAKF